jgi:single-strand DNA-binding protein
MAGNLNKVFLMGNLTRDVELKYTSGNQAVANFGVAVNRRYKAGDGELREEVTFVDLEAWGRTAENLGKFFSKGRPIFIEGRLKLDTWEDQQGNKRSKMRVVVENFQFVDSKSDGGGGGGGGRREGARSSAPVHDDAPEIDDDDIPF